ncbi:Outer membrane protein beta-barrel domain-containing protein [Parapedobacter composti]|uniref:Outer membrane protein beta-barrel domain-containing protein n=1 Tax=Parapedobacter composti TaxID=623281 RepID=A0A1I1KAF3_9SPHI|nr:outer membrane beta-barrel protein [Parapedobacter composti]SFC54510.1 Outer membrane protein beta-barrel domain-containing protein [Parapedobacter composti]
MKYRASVAYTIGVLLWACCPVYGQQRVQRWGGGVDDEPLHFGFSFHHISADYKIALKRDWQAPFVTPDGSWTADSLYGVSSPVYQGVGLGLLADLKLTENTNLRFTPTLAFSNKTVDYRYTPLGTGNHEQQLTALVRASYIDLPLLLKFKSDRKGNYRGYLIGGGKYSINVVSGKRYDDAGNPPVDKLLKTKPGYFSYEAGIGFDLYFDFFKMSPEVRWVQSIGNLLDAREPNMYNHPIQRLMLRNFQISLFFE